MWALIPDERTLEKIFEEELSERQQERLKTHLMGLFEDINSMTMDEFLTRLRSDKSFRNILIREALQYLGEVRDIHVPSKYFDEMS